MSDGRRTSPGLFNLAYGLLGSVAAAEDVLQDAELRLLEQRVPPEEPDAWRYRVVTNLALDQLRRETVRRREYPGPWLPEPLPTDAAAARSEALSMGLLYLLERLTPAERVVFLLKETFGYSFQELAELLDVSPAACRQRLHRARQRLVDEPLRRPDPGAESQLIDRLLEALALGDAEQVAALFSEDALAITDGGGVVSAAIRPVADPARIAQVSLHLLARAQALGDLQFERRPVNGGAGLLLRQGGQAAGLVQLEVHEGRIRRLYVVRNPGKLQHL